MPTYKIGTSYAPRLQVRIPLEADTTKTLRAAIEYGLEQVDSTTDFFGTSSPHNVAEYLRTIPRWKTQDGYIEHSAPDVDVVVYLATKFLGADETGAEVLLSKEDFAIAGVPITPGGSRHYVSGLDLNNVLIYAEIADVYINIDIQF